MSYKKFFEGGSDEQNLSELAKLLTNSTIRILWKHAETLMFKQKDKGIYGKTIFYVFYQNVREELEQELGDFQNKLKIAKEVSTDERYVGNNKDMKLLKNQRQRELFLLSEYLLSKTEAQDVIELLKPELAHIIRDSEKGTENYLDVAEKETEDVEGVIIVENPELGKGLPEKVSENKVAVLAGVPDIIVENPKKEIKKVVEELPEKELETKVTLPPTEEELDKALEEFDEEN